MLPLFLGSFISHKRICASISVFVSSVNWHHTHNHAIQTSGCVCSVVKMRYCDRVPASANVKVYVCVHDKNVFWVCVCGKVLRANRRDFKIRCVLIDEIRINVRVLFKVCCCKCIWVNDHVTIRKTQINLHPNLFLYLKH